MRVLSVPCGQIIRAAAGGQSWFEVSTGFKQGDVNAPMLFNVDAA